VSFDQKTLDSLKIERDAPRREDSSGRSWVVAVTLLVVTATAAPAGGGSQAAAALSHVINVVPTADRQKATVKARIGFDALDPRSASRCGSVRSVPARSRCSLASAPENASSRRPLQHWATGLPSRPARSSER
jgi:hypothetical protein